MRVRRVLAALVLAGCQGGRHQPAAAPPPARTPRDARAAVKPPAADAGPVDVGKMIADLGAIPAWDAVVDRAQYLARRNQHGVVYGTLGPAIMMPAPGADAGLVASPYTWLIDDTEGNGALAIRVELGARGGKLAAGQRVALGGAWALDDHRAWFWKVDDSSPLPAAPAPATKDPPAPPGHVIAAGPLPAGARPISKAGDNDLVYFQLVGQPPAIDGDGWPVADELGDPVVALLALPGERASYGAQDMRAPDERWHLRRGVTYALRVGIVHHHGPDKPATINARTAPILVE